MALPDAITKKIAPEDCESARGQRWKRPQTAVNGLAGRSRTTH